MNNSKADLTPLEVATHLIDNAVKQYAVFHGGKSMIVSYKVENGFTIDGRASLLDVSKFNLEKGFKICRDEAIAQLETIIAYNLQTISHANYQSALFSNADVSTILKATLQETNTEPTKIEPIEVIQHDQPYTAQWFRNHPDSPEA